MILPILTVLSHRIVIGAVAEPTGIRFPSSRAILAESRSLTDGQGVEHAQCVVLAAG